MSFSIEFLEEPVLDLRPDEKAAYGMLTIGAFQERFVVPLGFWEVAHYRKHWRDSLTRITESRLTSCLITAMYDPSKANFIHWWPLYPDADLVRIQNQLLFLRDLREPFDVRNPFRFIPPRETVSDEGEPISEWVVTLEEIMWFLQVSSRTTLQ